MTEEHTAFEVQPAPIRPPANSAPSLSAGYLLAMVAFFLGVILLQMLSGDFGPVMAGLILLLSGLVVTALSGGGNFEYRNFLLSFGVCVLVAGCAQQYSTMFFNTPMSTTDAITFERLIVHSRANDLDKLQAVVNAPLAVYVWKVLYRWSESLGFGSGPWLAVLFNALVVAISGLLTTKTARAMFGADPERLKRVGNLFAMCGSCWLLGAILLRDCFALLLNALVLWGLVRALCKPSVVNLAIALAVLVVSVWSMHYIRAKGVYMFGFFTALAVGAWYFQSRFTPLKLLAVLLLIILLALAYGQIAGQAVNALGAAIYEHKLYTAGSIAGARTDSLGAAYVVNQPLPIRAVIGSVFVLVWPIPIWGYFKAGLGEYYLIMGWQGVYSVFLMPMVLMGVLQVIENFLKFDRGRRSDLFILAYFASTVMVVAVTSMEIRHYAQFIPGLILMASLVKITRPRQKQRLENIRVLWFGFVVSIHIAWTLLRFII